MRSLLRVMVVTCCSAAAARADDSAKDLLAGDRPIEQVVDHYVDAALKAANVRPAPQADDATIMRRLSLDLVGHIPALSETADFLAASATDKKVKLVDRLLAAPSFARHQAQEFFTFLQASDDPRRAARRTPLFEYLLAGFRENRGWDRMFRDMMLPDEKDKAMRGAGEFLKSRVRDTNRLTIDASVVFLGVNVSCAQCHDHPHVSAWTQDHFYGMKSFFARSFDSGGFVAERDFGFVKYIPNKGKEKVAPVMFLTGKALDVPGLKEPSKEERKKEQERLDQGKKKKTPPAPPQFSLRAKLVETALAPGENDFFARSIVNRVWHRLFGRGLVMPLDQMHIENQASHPQLLQWLARDLVAHKYDLKRLIRGLVLSNAYARGSRWESGDMPPEQLFAVSRLRALTPMQMAVSLKVATTDPMSLTADGKELDKRLEGIERSSEGRASLFTQPGDNFQVSVSEALLFTNNSNLQRELLEGGGTLVTRLKQEPDNARRSDLAVRTVLSRPARAEEIQAISDYLQRRGDRVEAACQQIVWALLTSAEFRFNH
ncbi:MAG: DUF1549 domain-containing protein [Planctomycetes bacterium]|nr:DUF1549 domain-containing protein [Planctomycetota bacterium]